MVERLRSISTRIEVIGRIPAPRALALTILIAVSGPACVAPSTLSLSGSDDGRTVDVALGATLELALSGGGSVPYRWELERPPGPVLEQVGQVEERSANTDRVGAPGLMAFRFRARAPGEERLALVYREMFGGRQVGKRFEITVRAR